MVHILMPLTLLLMACTAQAATRTLTWDAPVPNPAAVPIAQYVVYHRGPTATSYKLLKRLEAGSTTVPVTLSTALKGWSCYQLRHVRWQPSTRTIVSTSPPAEVAGQPGCTALCVWLGAPARTLSAEECAP